MNPILIDTCVLIDSVRAKGTDLKLVRLFAVLPLAVAGVVRSELLTGAKDPADRAKLVALLNRFAQFRTAEPLWDKIGDNRAALRRTGVSVPYQDAVLATLAIDADLEVWTRDTQFKMIQRALPALRLFVEPP